MQQEFFTQKEVCGWLHVSRTTFWQARKALKILEPVHVGNALRWTKLQLDYARDVLQGDLTDAAAVAEWKVHRRARSAKQVTRRTRKEPA